MEQSCDDTVGVAESEEPTFTTGAFSSPGLVLFIVVLVLAVGIILQVLQCREVYLFLFFFFGREAVHLV